MQPEFSAIGVSRLFQHGPIELFREADIDARPRRHYTARINPMMIIPNTAGRNASP